MHTFSQYLDLAIKLVDNNWGATIIGWLLGWITAVWSNRQLARQQVATIKSLNDSIAAFADRIKDQLKPLDEREEQILAMACQALTSEDVPPDAIGLYFRGLAKYLLASLVVTGLITALVVLVGPFFLIAYVLSSLMFMGSFFAAYDAIPAEEKIVATKRLDVARQKLAAAKIDRSLADHLKAWARGHEFLFLEKAEVLRMIENALPRRA